MIKHRLFLRLLLIMFMGQLSMLSACKSRKNIDADPELKRNTTLGLNKEIEQNMFTHTYLSFRSKASYSSGNSAQSATLNIRMKKDSLIWVSVTALGIEAVRALLSKDSVYVIDRLNRTYASYGYDYLAGIIKAPVSFDQMQYILMGNPMYPVSAYRCYEDEQGIHMRYNEGRIENKITLGKELRVAHSELIQESENKRLVMQYGSFSKIDKQVLPLSIELFMYQTNSEARLTLNHSNVSTEAIQQFPFQIPQGYTRGN